MRRCIYRGLSCCALVVATSHVIGLAAGSVPGDIDWIRSFETIGPGLTTATAVAADSEGHVYVAGFVSGALPGQESTAGGDAFVRKYDGSGQEIWTRQFGTISVGADQALGIAVDVSGVYVVGTVSLTLPGQVSALGADAFVRKYDLAGNELWTRQFGTLGSDQAQAVFVDASGVYVTGAVAAALPGQTSAGQSDVFVRRYDTEGNEIWTRQFGTTAADRGLGVSADASGIYVAGAISPLGSADAFVRKYDASGNIVWTRQFGGIGLGSDVALAISADASGVYVAGSVALSLTGPLPDSLNAFVRKYSAAGAELWTQQFTTVGDDQAMGISVNASGVYVSGMVGTALPGQAGAGGPDAFLRKYTYDGIELWTRQFGTGGADRAVGVVAGLSTVSVVGAVGGALPGQTSIGMPDAFVRGYDTAGTETWTRQFGTTMPQGDVSRAVSAEGHIYVGGTFGVVLPLQPTIGGGFLRAYDSAGNEVWSRQISANATGLLQGVFGVAADASGVYVVGAIAGALPGQTNVGGIDAFIRKYDTAGNEVWTRQFGTSSSLDTARGVAVDATGVYVVGTVFTPPLPGQPVTGVMDAYIRKYDPAGNQLWTRQFGSAGSDQAFGVSADGSRVYVVGTVGTAFPGQASAGNTDAFVRAYDPSGVESWTAQFGTAGNDQALGTSADGSGVYVVGSMNASPPGPGPMIPSDAFVRKFASSGLELWADTYGTPSIDQATAVAAIPSGAYVTSLMAPGGTIRKYGSTGALVWARSIETSGDTGLPASGVSADESGVYVGGLSATVNGMTGAYLASIADFTPVTIDIKPGESPNSVNLGSNGSVPVAILSTVSFDATTIDPATVTLETASVALRGNGSPRATIQDVNEDGMTDLIVHVVTSSLQLTADATDAELRGRTFAGEPVRGTDSVRVVP